MQCNNGAHDALGIPAYRQHTEEKFGNICRNKELFLSLPSPLLQMLVERWGLHPKPPCLRLARELQGTHKVNRVISTMQHGKSRFGHSAPRQPQSVWQDRLKPCGVPGALLPPRAAPGHCLPWEGTPPPPSAAGLPRQL